MIMERWIGYNDRKEALWFVDYFQGFELRTKIVEDTNFTEALKLLSTSKYGINIVWADYEAKVAESIGMDYGLVKEFTMEYNRLYRDLGLEKRFQRYVLDAPNGVIGGHCVVPNAKLLNDWCPSDLLDKIIDMEQK